MIPHGYEITADGQVRRPDGTWQKFAQHPHGYFQFTATIDGKQYCFAVHRLVCERFRGPKPTPQHEVRHLNGNPADNRVENLVWGTKAENGADRVRHGTVSTKLTWDQVREIRERYTSERLPMRSLANEYGVTALTVSKIVRNIFWVDPHYTPPTDTLERRSSGSARGEQAGSAKLTWVAVGQIRQRYAEGKGTTRSLGSEFGVSAMTISKIIRNIFWVDDRYTPPTR